MNSERHTIQCGPCTIRVLSALLLTFSASTGAAPPRSGPAEHFTIQVVDAETGRGVPLVALTTTNAITAYTDSNGIIAWNEPGLMDRDVYFTVRSHGYAFSSEGRTLRTTPGARVVLKIDRVNVAERLYRITGQGIYRDSALVGERVPTAAPALNAEVVGQDSVFAVPYRDGIFWLWDDTSRAAGPLGSFSGCAATSQWPGRGGLDPSLGVDLHYLADDSGFCKPITPFPVPGMKWKYWATTAPDKTGRERLVIKYQSMKDLGKPVEIGLAVFDDDRQVFERAVTLDPDASSGPPIHPFRASDRGVEFVYFPGPVSDVRAPGDLEALLDPASYEGYSCLAPQSRYAGAATRLDRSASGDLRYGWKRNTRPLTFDEERELIRGGTMKAEEGRYQLRDIVTGAAIKPHAGSVNWNAHRARFIMIVQEDRGPADNGELWYAEGDTAVGPWVYARKIVTHDRYTFYNPTQHPFFDQDGGRLVYFEGTYSDSFSGSPVKTPRYDYNQIMYRLALDDSRLTLPVPVYRLENGRLVLREELAASNAWGQVQEIPFFALPPGRRREDAILVGGRFAALPAAGPTPRVRLSGRWSCTEGGGMRFLMTLQTAGELTSGVFDGTPMREVSSEGGTLAFGVEEDGRMFRVSLQLADGTLSGRWTGPGEEGTLTCSLTSGGDWTRSPDLVPLYEQRLPDGTVTYTTAAAGADRSSAPVARVWRNPMTVLAIDPGAVAVRARGEQAAGR